jgi:aryl-alcohol dehydrogenase-like predicted oxidoreductase
MKLRQLGTGGPLVSPIGLGGNVFGYFCDQNETRRIMDVALDNGINYVDTADAYSEGHSEQFIGAAVQGRRDDWFVATKAGIASDGTNRGLGRKANILRKVDASLKRLGTDYIDLYQMHHFDPITPLEETLGVLNDLVEAGKIRFAGVSNFTGEELRQSAKLSLQDSMVRIQSVQNLYHLLKREVERELIPACRDTGASVIAYGALARGILAGKYRANTPLPNGSRAESSSNVRADLDPAVLSIVQNLDEFARKRGKSVGQLALAWILRIPEVSTTVVGIRNEQQLLENLLGANWPLTQQDLANIDEIVGEPEHFRHLPLGARFRPE